MRVLFRVLWFVFFSCVCCLVIFQFSTKVPLIIVSTEKQCSQINKKKNNKTDRRKKYCIKEIFTVFSLSLSNKFSVSLGFTCALNVYSKTIKYTTEYNTKHNATIYRQLTPNVTHIYWRARNVYRDIEKKYCYV